MSKSIAKVAQKCVKQKSEGCVKNGKNAILKASKVFLRNGKKQDANVSVTVPSAVLDKLVRAKNEEEASNIVRFLQAPDKLGCNSASVKLGLAKKASIGRMILNPLYDYLTMNGKKLKWNKIYYSGKNKNTLGAK